MMDGPGPAAPRSPGGGWVGGFEMLGGGGGIVEGGITREIHVDG